MWKSSKNVENNDVKSLVDDAQALLLSTTQPVCAKTEELRCQAVQLLGQKLLKAQGARESVLLKGREMAARTGDYVNERPWHAIAAATVAGILLGTLLGRSKYVSELRRRAIPTSPITVLGCNGM
jgi:ElaB/YqjD/DUF883 family membrane-anchored ribosome-binding protein